MKRLATLALSLAATAVAAQTTNFNQVQHVETALNHFTVIDLGEPVSMYAVADRDSFDVERHDDKLFIKPLRDGAATNLLVWTPSRQVVYEIDPAGEATKMNMLIRNLPAASGTVSQNTPPAEPSAQDVQKIASLVLTETLMKTEEIALNDQRPRPGSIVVRLEEVFRAKDQIYIRYSIQNLSTAPFRITSPDVYQPSPTQSPISIPALRDHQLSTQMFEAFKVKLGPNVALTHSELEVHDLLPGQKTTGVIGIPDSGTKPSQLYQFDFGSAESQRVTAAAVL